MTKNVKTNRSQSNTIQFTVIIDENQFNADGIFATVISGLMFKTLDSDDAVFNIRDPCQKMIGSIPVT